MKLSDVNLQKYFNTFLFGIIISLTVLGGKSFDSITYFNISQPLANFIFL